MHFSRDDAGARTAVRSYTPGQIIIGKTEYSRSVVLTPERVITDWTPQNIEELSVGHFLTLIELKPEVVLLGTGAKQHFPAPDIMASLLSQGIGLEVMDTAAACRTFNVLLSESREVVAALLL